MILDDILNYIERETRNYPDQKCFYMKRSHVQYLLRMAFALEDHLETEDLLDANNSPHTIMTPIEREMVKAYRDEHDG